MLLDLSFACFVLPFYFDYCHFHRTDSHIIEASGFALPFISIAFSVFYPIRLPVRYVLTIPDWGLLSA